MILSILEISKILLFWKRNWLTLASWALFTWTIFRMGGSYLPVFPMKLLQTKELAPKSLWLLVSTPFPHLFKILRPYLVPVLNYWTWTLSISQKNRILWSNPYKLKVMITSVILMLRIPNFGHMTTFTNELSHVIKLFLWRHGQKLWRHSLYMKMSLF